MKSLSLLLPLLLLAIGTQAFDFRVTAVAMNGECPSIEPTASQLHSQDPTETSEFDSARALQELVHAMQKEWPHNRNLRFVFHGHSVPAGYFRTPEVRRFDSYPMLFFRELNQQFPHATLDISVTAIGGETSDRGAARFQQDVLALKPAIVFIDYSLNDRRIGLEKAEQAWSKMITACQQQQIPVVLLTPTPDSREDITDTTLPLHQHAAQIKRLGKRFGVPVIDSYSAFHQRVLARESVETYLSQSNHPNKKGHQVVADLLNQWFAGINDN